MSLRPDDSAAARQQETPLQTATGDALDAGLDRPWLTTALVSAMVAVHLALGARMVAMGRPLWEALAWPRGKRLLTRSGALNPTRTTEHFELWRLLSASFLHGDALHLLLNSVALFFLGRFSEAIYGRVRTLFLFVCTGTMGFAFSWLYRDDVGVAAEQVSVGASGAVFGLLGACIVFGWKYADALPIDQATYFGRKLAPWVVLNLVIGIGVNRLPWMDAPIVDNLAHVGGLVAGVILAMVLGNQVVPGEDGGPVGKGLMGLFSVGSIVYVALAVAEKWAAG